MNSKFIFIFFLCANIVALIFTFSCISEESVCAGNFNTAILGSFFNINSQTNIAAAGGVTLSGDASAAAVGLTNPETSAVSGTNIIGVFLDGLKMVGALISLLTPLPIIIFLNSLSIPLYISLVFSAILFLIWILGIAEFVRGSSI
jgi:hypothetical protein